MDYERITYREEGAKRSKTTYLRNTSEGAFLGAPVVMGGIIDRQGEWNGKNHVICTELITKRVPMRMNNFYGELEPVTEEAND